MAAGRLQLVPGEAGTFDLQKNPSGLPVHVFKGLPVSQCQGTKEYAEDSSPSLSPFQRPFSRWTWASE